VNEKDSTQNELLWEAHVLSLQHCISLKHISHNQFTLTAQAPLPQSHSQRLLFVYSQHTKPFTRTTADHTLTDNNSIPKTTQNTCSHSPAALAQSYSHAPPPVSSSHTESSPSPPQIPIHTRSHSLNNPSCISDNIISPNIHTHTSQRLNHQLQQHTQHPPKRSRSNRLPHLRTR